MGFEENKFSRTGIRETARKNLLMQPSKCRGLDFRYIYICIYIYICVYMLFLHRYHRVSVEVSERESCDLHERLAI